MRSNPTAGMYFRWAWRPYQERVLGVVDRHLSDRRLHLVAAPGAGKTVLGIEIFRRLGHPAVVLSPTRTVREQWIERLADFLPEQMSARPDWAGSDLHTPGWFTSVTYQALHVRYRASENATESGETERSLKAPDAAEVDDVAARLRSAGVRTVILDEAHHLRAEWWRVLRQLCDALESPTIVALTATPPYDVKGREWKRYEALCGPIDEEIGVPELVKTGSLCPHQDLVWAVLPEQDARDRIGRHEEAVYATVDRLLQDETLREVIRAHPLLHAEELAPDTVLERPERAIALMVYLRACGEPAPRWLLALFGADEEDMPAFDRYWAGVLLQHVLFEMDGQEPEPVASWKESMIASLRARGLIHGRQLRFDASPLIERSLGLSDAKVDACIRINREERSVRGAALRQVILTDYIRFGETERLGAWPVFVRLLEDDATHAKTCALLTGQYVALPGHLLPALEAWTGPLDAKPAGLPADHLVVPAGKANDRTVAGMTDLLFRGQIHTLVGTRSLLGEGWNAPAVNSLVIASHAGSYVYTNQIRGRAIRSDAGTPDKMSSIWHLVALEPGSPSGYADWDRLVDRFDAFVGLSAAGTRIESGFERLAVSRPASSSDVAASNAESVRRLQALGDERARWAASIEGAIEGRVGPTLDIRRTPPSFRSYHFARTLRFLVYLSTSVIWTVLNYGYDLARTVRVFADMRWVLIGAGLLGVGFSAPALWKAAQIAWKHAPLGGTLGQMALALQRALSDAGVFETPAGQLAVEATEMYPGDWSVRLLGGTYYEQSLFTEALAEVLDPIQNPRYLLVRRGTGAWKRRKDYHAVPAVLGANRADAEQFARHWHDLVGPGELVYLRNRAGRQHLLYARAAALARVFELPAQRRDRWH